jgi:hypothetical protein
MDAITAIKAVAAASEKKQNIIDLIALKKLGIRTLETRNSDRLDFHDLSVASIKEALETAFSAGVEIGLTVNAKKY